MSITEQHVGNGWLRFQSRKEYSGVAVVVFDPHVGEEAMIEVPRSILIQTLREAIEALEAD